VGIVGKGLGKAHERIRIDEENVYVMFARDSARTSALQKHNVVYVRLDRSVQLLSHSLKNATLLEIVKVELSPNNVISLSMNYNVFVICNGY
jgi:hypothetical protein